MVVSVAAALVVAVFVVTGARADTGYAPGAHGYDISYPQCPSRVPAGEVGFAIIGVNNGRPMTQNPCFPGQIAWAKKAAAPAAVYVNSSAPPDGFNTTLCASGDESCRSFEFGKQSAHYAMAYVDQHAPEVHRYWLDVETANRWSADKDDNAAVLRGMIDALEGAGKYVGIYSNRYQFGLIAGNFAPGLDNWIPRPEAKRDTAEDYCRTTPNFGGGRIVMIQLWYEFDENHVCGAPSSAPPPPGSDLRAGDIAVVAAGGECLNLRAGTGVNHAVRECLAEGTRVAVTGDPVEDDQFLWVPVTAPSGKSGWAAADYLVRATDLSAPGPVPDEPGSPPHKHRLVVPHVAGG